MGLFRSDYAKLNKEEKKAISRIAYAMIYADKPVSDDEIDSAESSGIKKEDLLNSKNEDLEEAIGVIAQSDDKTKKRCKKVIDKIMSANGFHASPEDALSIKLNKAWGLD